MTLPHEYPVTVAFSPDGRHLAAATEEGIGIWDIETQERVETLSTGDREVRDLVFSPDGRQLVAGFAAGDGASAGIWDTDTDERVGSLEHSNFVGSVAISSDGRTLATQGGVLGDAGGGVAGFVESGVRLWNPDDI